MRAPLVLIVAGVLTLLLQLSLMQTSVADSAAVDGADAVRPRLVGFIGPTPVPAVHTPYAPTSLRSPFDSERAAGAAASAATGAASQGFSLTGLVRGGGSASAIVRDPSGKGHVLRLGDSLQGWRLEAVGRDDVALSRGTERRTLTLNGPPAVLNRTSP